MFNGTTVALVTPFKSNGEIDYKTLRSLAQFHLKSGTDCILLAGCTGESFTLGDEERIDMLKSVQNEIGDSMPLILGTGASSTKVAVRRTKKALEAGADGALVITPFGNKPSQHALIHYFREVADIGLPIILYNVPGRTGTTISPQTAIELAKHPNIVAIKEASGSLDAVSEIIAGSNLVVLSGDDSLTVPMISIGAKGVISTTANLLPRDFSKMVSAALQGDFQKAAILHLKLFPIVKALFIEGNPVPLKTAMALAQLIPEPIFRPPLTGISISNLNKLKIKLEEYGVI